MDEPTGSQEQVVTQEASTSTTEANQTAEAKTPAVEQTVDKATEDNKGVPYPRFKEVNDRKNGLEQRVKELEQLVSQQGSGPRAKEGPALEKHVKKLIDAGLDENVAKLLAETQFGIASESVDTNLQPLRERAHQMEMQSWLENFTKEHKDYSELEPDMRKHFAALPETVQEMVVADPRGLELLYGYAKSKRMDAESAKKFEEGRTAAYENKTLKTALSTTPGTAKAAETQLTRKSVAEMDPAEYVRRRPEIMKLMQEGKLS